MAIEKLSEIEATAGSISTTLRAGITHGVAANASDLCGQVSDLRKHLNFVAGQIRNGDFVRALERVEKLTGK